LVDDEIYARKGLRNLIDWEACGFTVLDEADNGEDALLLIQSLKPDLVITDIRMPVLDGLELIRLAKEEVPEPPGFIIISGYDDFKYAQQAVRLGVHDFVLKPIDEDVLKSTLHKLSEVLLREKKAKRERERLNNERMLTALIKEEATEMAAADWARQYGMDPQGNFRYMLVEINDIHPWTSEPRSYDPELFKLSVQSHLSKQLRDTNDVYVHSHRNRLGFILEETRLVEQAAIKAFADELGRSLSEEWGAPVYVYAGKSVQRIIRLSESYQGAKTAALYKYIEIHESHGIVFEQIDGTPLNYTGLDQSLYSDLLERIEEQNREAV